MRSGRESFLNEFQCNFGTCSKFFCLGGKLLTLNLIFVHIVSRKTKIEDHNVTFEWPLMRSKEIIFESDI